MKLKLFFLVILLVQLGSCQKRYACLKKIRVHSETEQNPVCNRIKPIAPCILPVATRIRIPDVSAQVQYHFSAGKSRSYQNHSLSSYHKIPRSKKTGPSHTDPIPTPPSDLTHYPLWSFIFGILAIASVPLVLVFPVLGIPLAIIFSVFAFLYGHKALKDYDQTPEDKGKWMAVFGLITGALILSAVVALAIVFLLTVRYEASNQMLLNWFISLTTLFFGLMALLSIFSRKNKAGKVPESKERSFTPNGLWNKRAVSAFIAAILGLTFLLILAFVPVTIPLILAVFTIAALLTAIFMGVSALIQIRSSHQKGRLLAWVGILLVPSIILPPLPLLILYILFIIWVVKKDQKKTGQEKNAKSQFVLNFTVEPIFVCQIRPIFHPVKRL